MHQRQYKATFSPRRCRRPPPLAAVARSRRWQLLRDCVGGGPVRGHFPQHATAARRRCALQGVARLSAAWTGSGGWVTVARQGFPGVEGLETTGVKTLRGTRKTIRRTGREDCDLQIERLVLCSDHHRRRPLVSGDWTMFSLERRLPVRQAAIEPATLDSPRISFDHRKYRSRNFHCGKCAAGSKHVGGGTNAWGQRANH